MSERWKIIILSKITELAFQVERVIKEKGMKETRRADLITLNDIIDEVATQFCSS